MGALPMRSQPAEARVSAAACMVVEGSTAEALAATPGVEVGTDENNSSYFGKAMLWAYGEQANACAEGEANDA